MTSPVFQLVANLKGILYGERVKLDLQATVTELQPLLSYALEEAIGNALNAHYAYDSMTLVEVLYDYFLPELTKSERMSDDIRDRVTVVVTALWRPLLEVLLGTENGQIFQAP